MATSILKRLGRTLGFTRRERPRRQGLPALVESMERRWLMSGDAALIDGAYAAPQPTESALLLPAVQSVREAARRAGTSAVTDGTSNTIAFG